MRKPASTGSHGFIRGHFPRLISNPFSSLPLLCVAVLCLLLTACNDFERAALAELQKNQRQFYFVRAEMRDAALGGRISETDWSSFRVLAQIYADSHNGAAEALAAYHQAPGPETQTRARAALALLPGLLTEVEGFAKTALGDGTPRWTPGTDANESNPEISI